MSVSLMSRIGRLRVFPAPVDDVIFVRADGFVSPVDCLIEDRPWAQKIRDAQETAAACIDKVLDALESGVPEDAIAALQIAQKAEQGVFPEQDTYCEIMAAIEADHAVLKEG